jgi:hypothetical protein
MTDIKQYEELENFMMNIEELDKLSKYQNEVNFFEITGMVSKEIKHSNFLAWLFNSNANHGLGDKFIRKFMQKVIKANQGVKTINSDILHLSLLDYDTFIIKREWKNIDIFMVSDEEKFTITIENKIYSSERQHQTLDYRNKIEPIYKDYTNIYIYLTVEGTEAQDNDYWCNADYYMVKETIEEILNENINLQEDVKLLLKNYISMLGRDILMDKDIEKVCNEIYKKYKGALDLIYQYRPDEVAVISDFIVDYIEKNKDKYNIIFNKDYSSKSYIRFTTKFMKSIIPHNSDYSYGWKNGYGFMYEIEIPSNYKSQCVATISNTTDLKCIELYKLTQSNHKKFNIAHKNSDLPNLWARVFKSNIILDKEQIQNGLEECQEILVKHLNRLFEEEIPSFEKFIQNNIKN